jgi:UDP-N-acetylglucosamine transferase subunit ALG13
LSINEAVVANLDLIESFPNWQILHLTGETGHIDAAAANRTRSVAAVVLPYTHHMADALQVADLVISRAGASTLAEITAAGKPSILMPYPYHGDQHQFANAKCLASILRGSCAIRSAVINGPALRSVEELLTGDVAREVPQPHAPWVAAMPRPLSRSTCFVLRECPARSERANRWRYLANTSDKRVEGAACTPNAVVSIGLPPRAEHNRTQLRDRHAHED